MWSLKNLKYLSSFIYKNKCIKPFHNFLIMNIWYMNLTLTWNMTRVSCVMIEQPLGMFREICQYNWHIRICCDLTCGIVSRWRVAGRRGLLTFVVFVVETNIWCFWVESCVAFAFPVVLVLYCDYTLADNLIHPVDVWATCPVHCLHDLEVLPMGFSYNLYDLLFILIPRQHTKLSL